MTQQDGYDFEYRIQAYFEEREYPIFETPLSGDYGADLILYYQGHPLVIQCKYQSSPVGVSAVQQITAAVKYYHAEAGIVVTNHRFTRPAVNLAHANHVLLIDGYQLSIMEHDPVHELDYLNAFVNRSGRCMSVFLPCRQKTLHVRPIKSI